MKESEIKYFSNKKNQHKNKVKNSEKIVNLSKKLKVNFNVEKNLKNNVSNFKEKKLKSKNKKNISQIRKENEISVKTEKKTKILAKNNQKPKNAIEKLDNENFKAKAIENNKKIEFRNLTKRRLGRMGVISVIYIWQLFDKNIDIKEIKTKYFELTIDQLKLLNFIKKNYSFLRKVINLQLKSNWNWERILPLIRSILLVGAAELFFVPSRIVFNEAVEITKIFSIAGDNEFCFVNAVLQKIYNYYEIKNLFRN